VIKELKLRHMAKRILIVVPSHLKVQWRRELKERFNEDFEIIDRNRFNQTYQRNIWEKENQIITSMDFAKKDSIFATINAVEFDLVIVDEAHKMSAYQYYDKIQKSGRYKLGEVLSKNTQHMLFLTATTHKGDTNNFRLFLDLLKKGFFSNNEMIEESIRNKDNPSDIPNTEELKLIFLKKENSTLINSFTKKKK
jgi:superfamily II DNA or RNA helicase